MFQHVKREVKALTILNNPQPNQPLALYPAISHSTISSVLIMHEGKKQYPMYITSRTLQPMGKWYQTI